MNVSTHKRRVCIVGYLRTPFVRAGGAFASLNQLDISIALLEKLIEKYSIKEEFINEFFYGTVLHDPRVPNIAREVILRSKLPKNINAHFVANNCITGLVALSCLYDSIVAGRTELGIAGGVEFMSKPALTFPKKGEDFFFSLLSEKTSLNKFKKALSFRPSMVFPAPPSPKEPSTGLTMGEHCELIAKEFKIARNEQDEYALQSHKKAAAFQTAKGFDDEITPLLGVTSDTIIRADTTLEKLTKLKPVFDKSPSGTLTAGNSSSLTDGASMISLASESFAQKNNLPIFGHIEGFSFSSIKPEDGLLMAPFFALPQLFTNHSITVDTIDTFEIHEAFAAQVLANIQVWEHGWAKYPAVKKIGSLPNEKINIHGGSLALGHPFAATGCRLIMSALQSLKTVSGKKSVVSACAAGGMAGAALIVKE
jgi:acetyl-CoA acetyltransferase family protein